MPKLIRVTPKVYLVGMSSIWVPGLMAYLEDTGNHEFVETIEQAKADGLGDCEILSSFFAKLCYRALTVGKNSNVTRTRSIRDNIIRTIEEAHGSVFEHAVFNFVFRDVSRVLTHELVRHRVGVAYSQESGRYCRIEEEGIRFFLPSNIAADPILTANFERMIESEHECVRRLYSLCNIDDGNFTEKKTLTSAIRRIAPNGMANDIGVSMNLRSVRNILQARTNAGAEEEIRLAFGQVADLMQQHCPLILHGATVTEAGGIKQYSFGGKL